MKKYIIALCSILFILVVRIVLINVNSAERNWYINLEQVNLSEYEQNKIKEKIDLIDNILLSEFDKQKGIDQQLVLDVCIKYILSNYDAFKNNIVYLDNVFIFEENGIEYKTNYYVDKRDIQSMANKIFDAALDNINESCYYDNNTGFVALISKGIDEIIYEYKEISKVIKSANSYIVKVKYIVDNAKDVFFYIQYDIVNKNGQFVIKDIAIIK